MRGHIRTNTLTPTHPQAHALGTHPHWYTQNPATPTLCSGLSLVFNLPRGNHLTFEKYFVNKDNCQCFLSVT